MAENTPAAAPAGTPAASAPVPAAAAPAEKPADAGKPAGEIGNLVGDAKDSAAKPAADKADGNPPAEKPTDAKGKDGSADKPIEYVDFKLPEGVDIDKDGMAAFKTMATEQKLTQEGGQKLVDFHVAQLKKAAEAPLVRWREMQTEWVNEVKADPTYGGQNFEANRSNIAKMLDNPRFNIPGLREALALTGFGNNPAGFRFFVEASKAFAEGAHVAGQPAPAPKKSAAQTLYDKTPAPAQE